MNAKILSSLAALRLIACAAPQAETVAPQSPGDVGSASEPSDRVAQDPDAAKSDYSATKSHAVEREDHSVTHRSSEPAVPGDAVELGDFCSEHGIVANLNVERCVATPLGAKPDAQLWCSWRDELDDNRVLYFVALYRVVGKQLSKVIELPYAVGPKPLEERPRDITYYVKLFPDVTDDVASFEMRDEPGFNCDEAPKRLLDEYSNNPDLASAVEQSVSRVCSTRGKYSAAGRRQK